MRDARELGEQIWSDIYEYLAPVGEGWHDADRAEAAITRTIESDRRQAKLEVLAELERRRSAVVTAREWTAGAWEIALQELRSELEKAET